MLELKSEQAVASHYLMGGLFESMIISDLLKDYYNRGERPSLYFWRDSHGNEVDCIIDRGTKLIPIELNLEKPDMSYFKGLDYWNDIAQADTEDGYILYAGKENQGRSRGNIVSWINTQKIVDKNK